MGPRSSGRRTRRSRRNAHVRDTMEEQCVQLRGERSERADARQVLLIARERRLAAESAVGLAMIDLLDPGPQPRVQVGQITDVDRIEFGEELLTQRSVPALELALAGGLVRLAMDEADAQARADALQGRGTI